MFRNTPCLKLPDPFLKALEDYVAMHAKDVTAPILAKLDSIEESNKARFAALQWTIGILGFIIAAASLFSGLSRFLFH